MAPPRHAKRAGSRTTSQPRDRVDARLSHPGRRAGRRRSRPSDAVRALTRHTEVPSADAPARHESLQHRRWRHHRKRVRKVDLPIRREDDGCEENTARLVHQLESRNRASERLAATTTPGRSVGIIGRSLTKKRDRSPDGEKTPSGDGPISTCWSARPCVAPDTS